MSLNLHICNVINKYYLRQLAVVSNHLNSIGTARFPYNNIYIAQLNYMQYKLDFTRHIDMYVN